MLVLTRKVDEIVHVGDASIMVVRIDGDQVRLGINAPADVKIMRHELVPPNLINQNQEGGNVQS